MVYFLSSCIRDIVFFARLQLQAREQGTPWKLQSSIWTPNLLLSNGKKQSERARSVSCCCWLVRNTPSPCFTPQFRSWKKKKGVNQKYFRKEKRSLNKCKWCWNEMRERKLTSVNWQGTLKWEREKLRKTRAGCIWHAPPPQVYLCLYWRFWYVRWFVD